MGKVKVREKGEGKGRYEKKLTSMAFLRADCSHAWPSAKAQKRELARAYSRRLARTSSSISKAAKLAIKIYIYKHFMVRKCASPQMTKG